MKKIIYLPLKIKTELKPKIDSSIIKLSSAINATMTFDIPENFEYANELLQLNYNLSELKKEINLFNQWLDSCEKKFDNLEEELKLQINSIKKGNIRKGVKVDF